MKKDVLLFCCCLFVTNFIIAQANYIPGQIILSKGDTLTGYIDYRNWEKNPDRINFIRQPNGAKTIYGPQDVMGFVVEGDYYLSATVKREVSPYRVNALETHSTLVFEAETVFLQALILGEKSLYIYKDKTGHENFYIDPDGQLNLLEHKKYLKRNGDRLLIREVKTYSGQLAIYLQDCPDSFSLIDGVEYQRSSLKRLFKKYYECIGEQPGFERVSEKLSLKFGVLAGSTYTTLKMDAPGFPQYSDAEYTTSINPTGGIMLELFMPGKLKRWSLSNELLYTSFNIEGQYDDRLDRNEFGIYNAYYKYSHIKMANLIRYGISVNKVNFYLNAGISNGIVISEENRFERTEGSNRPGLPREGPGVPDSRKHEQAYILGGGILYKKFLLDLRMEKGNGISYFVQLGTYTSRYYFMLGYRF